MPTLDISSLKGSNHGFSLNIPDTLRLLEVGEKITPGMCVMRVPTPKHGDRRVVWNSNNFAEICDAKACFDELVMQGLTPYKVGVDGKPTSEVMTEFDPHAEEIFFVPMRLVQGG